MVEAACTTIECREIGCKVGIRCSDYIFLIFGTFLLISLCPVLDGDIAFIRQREIFHSGVVCSDVHVCVVYIKKVIIYVCMIH